MSQKYESWSNGSREGPPEKKRKGGESGIKKMPNYSSFYPIKAFVKKERKEKDWGGDKNL